MTALQDRASLGIAMTLVAWACFTVTDTSVKYLAVLSFPAIQLAFMRYFPHFIISTIVLWQRKAPIRTPRLGICLLRGALLASATVCNFVTLAYLPLSITGAIMFASPIILCALSWPLLGERVGPWRWLAIMLGFIGVLVVIRPFGETVHWIAILNVYNATALALYSVLTRKIAGEVAPETMQFWMGIVGVVAFLPGAIWFWVDPGPLLHWVLMIVAGVAAWTGHEFFSRAHSYAPANTLMPYTYSFLLYLALASYLVFGEVPDGWTLVGSAIIMLSGLIIWHRTRVRPVTLETP